MAFVSVCFFLVNNLLFAVDTQGLKLLVSTLDEKSGIHLTDKIDFDGLINNLFEDLKGYDKDAYNALLNIFDAADTTKPKEWHAREVMQALKVFKKALLKARLEKEEGIKKVTAKKEGEEIENASVGENSGASEYKELFDNIEKFNAILKVLLVEAPKLNNELDDLIDLCYNLPKSWIKKSPRKAIMLGVVLVVGVVLKVIERVYLKDILKSKEYQKTKGIVESIISEIIPQNVQPHTTSPLINPSLATTN